MKLNNTNKKISLDDYKPRLTNSFRESIDYSYSG